MGEIIKDLIADITIFIAAITLVLTVNKSLKIYQDSRYKIKESLIYIWRFYRQYYLYLSIIPFIFILDLWYMQLIYLVYISYLNYQLLSVKTITKLKFTPRIIRHIIAIVVIFTAIATLLLLKINFPSIISLIDLLIITSPVLTIICGIIVLPVELLVVLRFKLQAKRKLKKYRPTIIGITGSCGKTSVKNYLYAILKNKQLVYMSPKSFNTINGISMTINEYLNYDNTLLILEMGATKLNDIEELVNYTHPQYGFVTEIVPQHINTFKTIDNIITEKFKLIESLPENGVGFLNYDNKYIREYPLKPKCKIITYGTTPDCHIYATDVKMSLEGLSFCVNYHDGSFYVKTKLVGLHNVNNLLGAIACSLEFKTSIQEIIDGVLSLEAVKHRLEIRHENDLTFIDDAYNSNSSGFINALTVLGLALNKKTLITPGIIEAGNETKNLNYGLAKKISEVCDQVILVDNQSSRYILEGLTAIGYNKVTIVSSYQEGIKLVNEGTVLIENDLPDNYFI